MDEESGWIKMIRAASLEDRPQFILIHAFYNHVSKGKKSSALYRRLGHAGLCYIMRAFREKLQFSEDAAILLEADGVSAPKVDVDVSNMPFVKNTVNSMMPSKTKGKKLSNKKYIELYQVLHRQLNLEDYYLTLGFRRLLSDYTGRAMPMAADLGDFLSTCADYTF